MKEGEALFRAVVEHAPDGIVAFDEQGTVTLFNPAAERLFGYTAAEVVGQHVNVLVPEPRRQELDEYIRNDLRAGQAKMVGFARKLTGLRKRGETFPFDIAVNEASVETQRVFIGVVRDGIERQQTEAELVRVREQAEQASRDMSAFLSRIRHEMRTPLNAMLGFAQLLEMKSVDAKQKEWVGHILKAGQHLLSLMNESAGSERSASSDGRTT